MDIDIDIDGGILREVNRDLVEGERKDEGDGGFEKKGQYSLMAILVWMGFVDISFFWYMVGKWIRF
ncbi:hypothetical protein QE450_000577 [Paenibacillus sp. SORGH_AS306]|uniref:hypothetical protein n=1 Tax=unclassified Paenibacillus TaxID=185978 RepID=UPI002786EB5B|nr:MULTISPECIES: hypothetical protein [unclassified Paenibacillus]MDQ1233079.1 hypothetical protein [Paenibacillus sp. SORGH_AS_0306]MDR6110124.1 hypothetical protein [Paenibacillus sp. SORGH_AS_0338]